MSQAERKEAVNEIRILASVEHTNVIRFCEAFVLDDQLYIITEFANHGDLFQKLQRWCVIPTFPKGQSLFPAVGARRAILTHGVCSDWPPADLTTLCAARWSRSKKKGQRLPEDLVWVCFIQLCLGVQSLHRNKILHRDLKSANVFLASNNTVRATLRRARVTRPRGALSGFGCCGPATSLLTLSPLPPPSLCFRSRSAIWASPSC